MSITLTFPSETEKKLHDQARRVGQTVEGYIQRLVEREVLGEPDTRGSCPLEEACTPIANAVRASGLTDDRIDGFFTEVRDEIRAEKRAKLPVQPRNVERSAVRRIRATKW